MTGPAARLPAGRDGVARRWALAAAALAAVLLLAFAGFRAPVNPDEPRDLEIARGFASGAWSLRPLFNGGDYDSKPPLFFWLAGFAMRLLGEDAGAGRVAAALLGVATAAATAALGARVLGDPRGGVAGVLLAGTVFFVFRFRHATTDAAIACFAALSMACLLRAPPGPGPAAAALGGTLAGLAGLGKGLHGLLFPLAAWAAFAVARRTPGELRRLPLAAACGAAVFAAWLLAVAAAEGRAEAASLGNGLLLGNLENRFGDEAHHSKGPFYYLVLVTRFLPWTPLLAAAAWLSFRRDPWSPRVRPVAAAAAALLVLLSLAAGKRSPYLLPVFPLLAVATAGALLAAVDAAAPPRGPARLADLGTRLAALPLAWWPPVRRDLLVAAAAAACLHGAGLVAYDRLLYGPGTRERSAAPIALAAAAAAGDRPLVLLRAGTGDAGQFCFALRRAIPVAWNDRDLDAVAAGRAVVVLGRPASVDAARARGTLDPSAWRLLGEGLVDREEPWCWWERAP